MLAHFQDMLNKFVGGRISHPEHVEQWEKLTSDVEILQAVRGDIIQFINIPPVKHEARPCNVGLENEIKIDDEIKKMLRDKIIIPVVHEQVEYVSPIFRRPKPDGGTRVVLNLKQLNKQVQYHHFKMDNIKTVLASVTKGCYMASLDLKGAYHSVKIDEEHQVYLRFVWDQELYQFTCYPNGLGPCPRKFTKIMKVPLSHLRKNGHFIIGYIDDFFLKGKTKEICMLSLREAATLFEKLGFTIHPDKSSLNPEHVIVFLGFVINSITMTVKLTEEKMNKLLDLIEDTLYEMHTKGCIKIRTIATIIGKMVSSLPGTLFGALHYRTIEYDKNKALKSYRGDYEGNMTLSGVAMTELHWWKENLPTMSAPIHWPPITEEMTTDASGKGWGAHHSGTSIGGAWTPEESDIHINIQEMLAVLYALRSFVQNLQNKHVRILSDNTVTVSVLNKMGSCRSLECNYMGQQIWKFCGENNIFITCTHIPGVENTIADEESRREYKQGEWMLNKEIFHQAVQHFRFSVDIDCFATRINTQVEQYASRKPDPFATHINAFSFNWNPYNCYIFPPFSVINKVLQKIRIDQATVLGVFPRWTTQAWWPELQQMMIQKPLILEPKRHNLILPNKPGEKHPLHKKLGIVICIISGKDTN